MRIDPRTIDPGMRRAVLALNRIPGIRTRASCEGCTAEPGPHQHAALAYVALRHPMPLRLQSFLLDRLDRIARVEDDAVYSRWPAYNHDFVAALTAAAGSYLAQGWHRHGMAARRPLTRVRARVARALAVRHDTRIGFCGSCRDLIVEPHPAAHRALLVLPIVADQEIAWFAEFTAQPGNGLDAALIAVDGWTQVMTRALRGDFGQVFRRRWLRHRAARIHDLATRAMRQGVELAHRSVVDIDFFYDETQAVFVNPPAWRQPGPGGS